MTGKTDRSRRRKREADALYKRERFGEALAIYQEMLKAEPESHWLMARISSCVYELRDYDGARRWAHDALERQPRCPLALWHAASASKALRRHSEVALIYRGLLRRGWRRMAFGRCGEGEAWSRSLLNDCRLELARCLAAMGELRKAEAWGRRHLRMRDRTGIRSIYSREDAVRMINEIVVAMAGR